MQIEARAGRAGLPVRQLSSAYLMSWVALAAFGLGYIGVAATRPELLGTILPLAEPSHDQIVSGRTNADVADELATLRKWVNDLQHELASTKNALQEQAAGNAAVLQRLAAFEERLSQVREVRSEQGTTAAPAKATVQRLQGRAQAPAQTPPAAQAQAQAPAQVLAQALAQAPAQPPSPPATAAADAPARPAQIPSAPPPVAEAAAAAGAGANVRVLNAGTGTSPITTGSVPDAAGATTPVAGFGQTKVTPAAAPGQGGPRAIEIASSDTLDGLRAKWGELSGRNGDVLGDLAPRYRLSADGRSAPFTLLAGPIENAAEATRICATLRAKGLTCRVGAFSGNAF